MIVKVTVIHSHNHSYGPVDIKKVGWLYESLLMTCMVLHARCAITTATMRVQNNASSRIKRDSC